LQKPSELQSVARRHPGTRLSSWAGERQRDLARLGTDKHGRTHEHAYADRDAG